MYYVGEDNHMSFSNNMFGSYLSSLYVGHYACAAADTWASELGILSKANPRLVTTLFLRKVPHGTNGGCSILGTFASAMGGAFIGFVYWICSYFLEPSDSSQYPMIIVGLVCGVLGSLFDSILGATLQASYYSKDRKQIVKTKQEINNDSSVELVCGIDFLSNEAVNLVSILLTMAVSVFICPKVFCLFDSTQC